MRKRKTSHWLVDVFAAVLAAVGIAAHPVVAADTVLITGANSGIGLELTKQYAAKGWTVIATHRRSAVPESLAAVTAQSTNVRVETLDVTDIAGARALAAKLRDVPIDVLINNAGVYNDRRGCRDEDCAGDWGTQTFGQLDYELFDNIMAVNVRGPLVVSEAFIDQVRASTQKKIIAISSTNGSLTAPYGRGGGAIFYRTSKAALNRSMQLVAEAQRESGVTVVMLHPGAVVTERQAGLRGAAGMIELPFSAENLIATIDKITIADTGHFLNYDGTPLPW